MILRGFPPLGDQFSERLFAYEGDTVRDSFR